MKTKEQGRLNALAMTDRCVICGKLAALDIDDVCAGCADDEYDGLSPYDEPEDESR